VTGINSLRQQRGKIQNGLEASRSCRESAIAPDSIRAGPDLSY